MQHIFLEAHNCLFAGETIAMAAIIRHAGSSPRSTGARMLVHADGSIAGTVGGGLLEAEAIQHARAALAEGRPRIRRWNFNGPKAGEAGMICGGQVELLIQPLSPENPADRSLYAGLAAGVSTHQKTWLVTHIEQQAEGSEDIQVDQTLIPIDGGPGAIGAWVAENAPAQPKWVTLEEAAFLVEPVTSLSTAYIFGAGHVSQMLASLTGWVGFRTVVIDNRAEFANPTRFPQADEVLAVETYEQAFKQLEVGPEGYVVIVTRGHADDLKVAVEALRTPAGYIGMIGSRRKRELMYRALLERGFTQADLARIHSPIGTDIGAETPEEIAISIAGEMIKARAGK
jgi:xanthine dehydrogenase accessory factor